jgi:hypothetical protein
VTDSAVVKARFLPRIEKFVFREVFPNPHRNVFILLFAYSFTATVTLHVGGLKRVGTPENSRIQHRELLL